MPEAIITAAPRASVPVPDPRRRGPGSESPAPDSAEALAAHLVDALAVAWTMFRVYNDPRHQDAFRRAVATLGAPPAFPWTVEVHGEEFRCEGLPIPARRQAAPALARAAFARGIAALRFSAPPTPDDLLHLFEVLAFRSAAAGEAPSPIAALEAMGVTRLTVVEHGRLTGIPEGLEEAEPLVPPTDGPGAGPAGHGDPSRQYLEEYRLLYERLQAGDFSGLQELVHGFTDSFFALPRDQQTRLFEQFLTRHEEEPFRLLLDQFSQDDLAELAQLLSPGTHPLLVEYARIAAEQDGQSTAAAVMVPAEQMVFDRISHLLRSGRAGLRRQVGEALRAQIPGPEANLRAAGRAAAALFPLSDEEGFARLARAVAGKVATALDDGDLDRVASWLPTLLAGAPAPERKNAVRREMEAALRPDILDRLVPALTGKKEPPPAVVTLIALFALDQMVERLALEEDKRRRKALVDLVTAAARLRPGPLIEHLDDPRWYLVRNLVDALAHSGRPEAVAPLRAVCSHADHRVRREARRTLPLLDPAEGRSAAIEALHDPEPALRLQALGLLRSALGPEVEAALIVFIASRPPLEERLAAIDVLARRPSGPARTALRHLGHRRLWASAATREAARAARRALHGEGA